MPHLQDRGVGVLILGVCFRPRWAGAEGAEHSGLCCSSGSESSTFPRPCQGAGLAEGAGLYGAGRWTEASSHPGHGTCDMVKGLTL